MTNVYPASHYVTPSDKLRAAIADIDVGDGGSASAELEAEGRALEAARLRQRTTFDLEMMRELGYCTGIENYSRHLSRREAGERPWTLLDYFPPDWLLVVDESHMTIPQVVGMYKGDRTRKEILVDFGFRLPSALDNRPLTFEEFEGQRPPGGLHERDARSIRARAERARRPAAHPPDRCCRPAAHRSARPRARSTTSSTRSAQRVDRGERVLVTTLTKKMAEDLADYLQEMGVRSSTSTARSTRSSGSRSCATCAWACTTCSSASTCCARGSTCPEVTLVAILDADKEGFLRSGLVADPDDRPGGAEHRRRGRHVRGHGDRVHAGGDRRDEPAARDPGGLQHGARDRADDDRQGDPRPQHAAPQQWPRRRSCTLGRGRRPLSDADRAEVEKVVARMEAEMKAAAKELEFERAAALRDEIQQIRLRVLEQDASVTVGRAAERAAASPGGGLVAAAERARGRRRDEERAARPAMEVTSVAVLPAEEEPAASLDGEPGGDEGTASDWLPGIRDEHEDEAGWQARWLERPTWDVTVTPNVIRRTGTRPPRPGRRRR